MKSILQLLIILFLLIQMVQGQNEISAMQIGNKAPAFALPNLQNEYIALKDFCGEKLRKPWKNKTKYAVVLSFFATWCKPCIAEIPHLQKVKEKFQDKPVKFYLVNVGESRENINKFFKGKNISIPILLDRYKKISEKYDALKLPRLFILDQNGFIKLEKRGFSSDGDKFENEIETLLSSLFIN